MAAPVVAALGAGTNTSVDATTHNVAMPAGITAGDILMVFAATNGASTVTPPAGYTTLLFQVNTTASGNGVVFYKRAVGGETATTFSTSAIEQSYNYCCRITGAHTTSNPEAAGVSQNPAAVNAYDPPNLAPTWGATLASQGILWFSVIGCVNGSLPFSASPAPWTDISVPAGASGTITNGNTTTGAAGVALGIAQTNSTASSMDPPTGFTITTTVRSAGISTVGVPPAAAAAAVKPRRPVQSVRSQYY